MRPFIALTSALWTNAAGRRRTVVVYAVFFVISNILWLLTPYVVGEILNSVQQASANTDSFRTILLLLFGLILIDAVSWLFHGPARVMERETAFHIRATLKQKLFSIVTALPMQWHKQNHSGRTINRISKATNALFRFTENGFQIIEMIIRPIGALVALWLLMPIATVIAVVIMVGSFTIVFLFDKKLFPLYGTINEKEHSVASVLHDYITNITTVITLRLEALAQSELLKRMTHYFPVFQKEVRTNELKWFTATMLISFMTAIVLGWHTWVTMSSGGTLLAGTFFMLFEYLQKIGAAFYTFAWKYGDTVEQYADLLGVEAIFAADRALPHADCRIARDWKTIEIRNLDFTYKDEETRSHHLRNVSLKLERGRKIAFIGESGSGKSTLMTLLRGLQIPDRAEVLCDGHPLPHGLPDVGSTVTLIPQEPEIFENTVEYNITLDTEQEAAEVMEDVALARFASVLGRLPKGLQTHTAEKGVNLSGGEKQRLALARGFFAAKESSLILLDEPTSSVDPENERAIYENLFRKFADRCVVSSLHKLYLLPMFDEAYVFKDGQVIAHGTPKELLSEGGVLHPLWVRERSELAAS